MINPETTSPAAANVGTADITPTSARVGITNPELAQLDQLVRQLRLFDSQLEDLRPHFAQERFEQARQAYIADLTASSFEALKNAAVDHGLLEKSIIPDSVIAVVEGAREGFAHEKLLSFARPILERNLGALRDELSAITEAEDAMHLKLFGTPTDGNSVKIAAVQARVDGLGKIQRLCDRCHDSGHRRQVSPEVVEQIGAYLEQLPLLEQQPGISSSSREG